MSKKKILYIPRKLNSTLLWDEGQNNSENNQKIISIHFVAVKCFHPFYPFPFCLIIDFIMAELFTVGYFFWNIFFFIFTSFSWLIIVARVTYNNDFMNMWVEKKNQFTRSFFLYLYFLWRVKTCNPVDFWGD